MSQAVFKETDYDRNQVFSNMYARSKFEAEAFVREAMANGLNATIYRVGILVGESTSGKFQRSIETNAFYGLIKSVIYMGVILDGTEGSLEMTPIDSCREAIVKLMLLPETSGRQLHVYNPNFINFHTFADFLQSFGYHIKSLPADEYLNAIKGTKGNEQEREALEKLVPHIAGPSSPKTRVVYDNSITQHFLDFTGFVWPTLDEGLVYKLINYCISTGFIKPPVSRNTEATVGD